MSKRFLIQVQFLSNRMDNALLHFSQMLIKAKELGIQISHSENLCQADEYRTDNLYKLCIEKEHISFLDYHNPSFAFMAKLLTEDELVGVFLLNKDLKSPEDRAYRISTFTHPDYRNRGIATCLGLYTVNFALPNKSIENLFAWVEKNSISEGIFKNLGFMPGCMTGRKNNLVIQYTLDTKIL